MDGFSNLYSDLDPKHDKRFKETENIIRKQIERSQNILDDQLTKTAALIERQIERARSFLKREDNEVEILNEETPEASHCIVATITIDPKTDVNHGRSFERFSGSLLHPITDKSLKVIKDNTKSDDVKNDSYFEKVKKAFPQPIRDATPDASSSTIHKTSTEDVKNDENFQRLVEPLSHPMTNKAQCDNHSNRTSTQVNRSSYSKQCDAVSVNDSFKEYRLSSSNPMSESLSKHMCIQSTPTIASNFRCLQLQRFNIMKDSSTSTTDLLRYVKQSKLSSSSEEYAPVSSAMPVDSETDAVSTSYDYSSISFDTVIFNNKLSRKNIKITDDTIANLSDNANSSSLKTESKEISSLSCVKSISKDEDDDDCESESGNNSLRSNEVDPVKNKNESCTIKKKEMSTRITKDETVEPMNNEYNQKQNDQTNVSDYDTNEISNDNAYSSVEICRNGNQIDDDKPIETECVELSSADFSAGTEIVNAKPNQVTQVQTVNQAIQTEFQDGILLWGNTQQSTTTNEEVMEEFESFHVESQTQVGNLEEITNCSVILQTEETTESSKHNQVVLGDSKTMHQSDGSANIETVKYLAVDEKEITMELTVNEDVFNDSVTIENVSNNTNGNKMLRDTDLDQDEKETCSSKMKKQYRSHSDCEHIDSSIKSEKCITMKSTEKPNAFAGKPVNVSRSAHDTCTQSEPIWDDGCNVLKDTASYPVYSKSTLKRLIKEDTAVFSQSDNTKSIVTKSLLSGESRNSSAPLDDTESEPIWNFDNTKIKSTSSYPLLLKTTPKRILKDNSFPFWKSHSNESNHMKPTFKGDDKHVKKVDGFANSYPLNKCIIRGKLTTTIDKPNTFPLENEADDEDDTISNTSFIEESLHSENSYEPLGDEEFTEKSENPFTDNKYSVLDCSQGMKEEKHGDRDIHTENSSLFKNVDELDPNEECDVTDIKSHDKADSGQIIEDNDIDGHTGKYAKNDYISAKYDRHEDDFVKYSSMSYDKKKTIGLRSQQSVSNISKSYSKMRYVDVDMNQNDDARQTQSFTEYVDNTGPKTEQFPTSKADRRGSSRLSKQGSILETGYLSSNISSGSSHEKLISVCCPTGTKHREHGEECDCVRFESEKQTNPRGNVSPTQEINLEKDTDKIRSPTNVGESDDNNEFSVSPKKECESDDKKSEQLPSTSVKEKQDNESLVDSNMENLDSSYFERERYIPTPSLDSTDLSFTFEDSETSSLVEAGTPRDGTTERQQSSQPSNPSTMEDEHRSLERERRSNSGPVNSFCESDISIGNENLSSSIIQFSSMNASIEGSTEDIIVDESSQSCGSDTGATTKRPFKRKLISSTFSSTQSIRSSGLADDFTTTSDFGHDPLMDKTSLGDATDVEDTFLVEEDLDSTTISNKTDVLGTSSETATQVENPAYHKQ